MKVLFEFSRGGLPELSDYYQVVKDEILQHGHSLTNDLLKDTKTFNGALPEGVFTRLSSAIIRADCVIIEGSVVSLSLGYVLVEALNLDKPVLFLTKNSPTSQNRFASSIHNKLLVCKNYNNVAELSQALKYFFDHNRFAKTRFNLVLPNRMNRHVTVSSKKRRLTKTAYILSLIEDDMRKSDHDTQAT